MTKVSIILPTFNEKKIAQLLTPLISYVQSLSSYRFELVIVDDSIDGTYEILEKFVKNPPVPCLLVRGTGKGKGSAIQQGILASSGDVVFYMDADLTIPIENIPHFIRLIDQENYDVVIGERASKRDLKKFSESPLRFFLSIVLLYLQRYFIFQSHFFSDTQCGFKAFSRSVAQRIASLQRVTGGMYDIEYLYIALKNRLKIAKKEVQPLAEVRSSRIRVFRCMIVDPAELIKTKLLGLVGHYRFKDLIQTERSLNKPLPENKIRISTSDMSDCK